MPPRASQIDKRTNPPPAVKTQVINAAHFIGNLLIGLTAVLYTTILTLGNLFVRTGASVQCVSRLDAVGDHSLRTTALFVRAQARSVTADEVARALALPRPVARWRLEKLAAAGLLDVAFERRSGRSGRGAGRPAKTYAPAAETAAIEFPWRRYETLASLLMAALPARRRSALLSQVGIEYGKELATAARLRRARTI